MDITQIHKIKDEAGDIIDTIIDLVNEYHISERTAAIAVYTAMEHIKYSQKGDK